MLEATLRKHPKTLSPHASLCKLASEAQSKQHGIRGIALREKETYIHRWETFARRRRIPYLLWILSQTDWTEHSEEDARSAA